MILVISPGHFILVLPTLTKILNILAITIYTFDRYNYNNMRLNSKPMDEDIIRMICRDNVSNNRGKLKLRLIKKSKSKRYQQKINEMHKALEYPKNPLEKVRIKIKKSVKLFLEQSLYKIISEEPSTKTNTVESMIASYLLYMLQFDNDKTIYYNYIQNNQKEDIVHRIMAEYIDKDNEYDHIEISRITLYYLRTLKYDTMLKNDSRTIFYLMALFSDKSKYIETCENKKVK